MNLPASPKLELTPEVTVKLTPVVVIGGGDRKDTYRMGAKPVAKGGAIGDVCPGCGR